MDTQRVRFWAKTTSQGQPGISVFEHGLNVGCVAQALVETLPDELRSFVPPGAITLAALHDLGKISPGFAVKCPAWVSQLELSGLAAKENWANCQPNHALVSQWVLQQLLPKAKLHGWSAAVGAHHGRPNEKTVGPFKVGSVGGQFWLDARSHLVTELSTYFGPLPIEPPENDATLWFVAGLITVADWIGSDEEQFSPEGGQTSIAPTLARRALHSIGWEPAQFKTQLPFNSLFPACNPPRPLQTAALSGVKQPGLYIIEAQMGAGKTEAALAAAYHLISEGLAGGLYFALPTQVTSNRIHRRVADFLARVETHPDPRRLRLAHSNSWLLETAGPPVLRPSAAHDPESLQNVASGRSWFASSKRAILAPYGVGTIDQILLGIVAAKHFFVRQFGIASKVVILDELHTYDLFTGTLVDVLVRRLLDLKCTVIILSATLTASRRRELLAQVTAPLDELKSDYPLLTLCTPGVRPTETGFQGEPPRTIHVAISTESYALVAQKLLQRARAGECVLWVRNTVREAQEAFRALRCENHEDGPSITLLHSRFPQFRREELESLWLERLGKESASRPNGCVLVATQVVEQSVDIDADYLVTDLAPTDMLLQRLGRLWRHARANRPCEAPKVQVTLHESLASLAIDTATARELKTALGPSSRVYAPYVLLRSLAEWRLRTLLSLPADIRPLLEATYEERSGEPSALNELRAELEKKKNMLRQLAINNTNVWTQPALADEEGVQTRYNSCPSGQLLLVRQVQTLAKGSARVELISGDIIEANSDEWSFVAAKGIHRNLVRLPRYSLAAALPAAPAWLRLHTSGESALGVVRGGEIYWPGADRPSGLNWHPDEGVFIPSHQFTGTKDDYESYD
jgi:CRISPR-associated endonuclease/helicase Cas3